MMVSKELIKGYTPPITAELRARYEEGLSQTMRWEKGLLTPDMPESDLDHVGGMFEIRDEIAGRFVHIPNEVNFVTVGHMIYIHDGGEVLTSDLSHSHPEYDILKPRLKRREIAAFRFMSINIEDEPTKKLTRELYRRVHEKAPYDKESQFTDLLDKLQAVRFGLQYVFHGSTMKNAERRAIQLNHAIEVLLKPTEAFIKSLKSPYSKEEALIFINEELQNFARKGYRSSEISPYLRRVSSFSINGIHS